MLSILFFRQSHKALKFLREMTHCQRSASKLVILGEKEDTDHEQDDAAGHDHQV
jgi:hypothetical protein